eukprot:scaffold308873_cov42-Prasinocladus_malaysianus.AAC.1
MLMGKKAVVSGELMLRTGDNAYLYIEGKFFNSDKGTDLSEPIKAFCIEHNISAPPPNPASPQLDGERLRMVKMPRTDDTPAAHQSSGLEGIITQNQSRRRPIYPMRTATLEGTTFADLWLRVGLSAGNLYCHQGCCEHMIAFGDVRQIHPTDPQSRSAYPLIVYRRGHFTRLCDVCRRRQATK